MQTRPRKTAPGAASSNSTRAPEPRRLSENEAKTLFWLIGDLAWKLKPCQKLMLAAILASDRFKYVIKCARRLGKSYLLCLLAISVCLRKPNAQVRYAAPTAKALKKIVRPIMNRILADCPRELRPKFISSEGMYQFPNGSQIHLAGVNNGHADDLRGPATDYFLIDEARDIDELEYLVRDVALPQLLDIDGQIVKGRRLIVASSPAASPAHEFSSMAKEAEVEGYYSHYDIFDGGYSDETIRMFFKEDGLSEDDVERLLARDFSAIKSSTVKREYLALDVIDEDFAVVAEWQQAFVFEREVTPYDQFYHRYIWMDIGVQRDFTVMLFVLYDFRKAQAYVEDELVIRGPLVTTDLIAKELFAKTGLPDDYKPDLVRRLELTVNDELLPEDATKEEIAAFKTAYSAKATRPDYANCYRRIADNSHPLLLNDLLSVHGVPFTATDKAKLHEMVNALKNFVKSGRLGAHPRCKHFAGAIETGTWNNLRTEFARSKVFGHYDAIAAGVYGVRNLDQQTNPIPKYFGVDTSNRMILPSQAQPLSPIAKKLKEAFRQKPRR